MHFRHDGGICTSTWVTVTHLSTSIRSRSFIAQKASYWLYLSIYLSAMLFTKIAFVFQNFPETASQSETCDDMGSVAQLKQQIDTLKREKVSAAAFPNELLLIDSSRCDSGQSRC